MNRLDLGCRITFYLSLLCLGGFIFLLTVSQTDLAEFFLYLMLIFWGVNKVFSYFHGSEIRLTYAVKISEDAPHTLRIMALAFAVSIALYGAIELLWLSL